ncbi:MAG TPA: hypothetical protein VGV36_05535 [Solirubrobacteraceae bacterium]|nr:hypothetical protein [Solirubrobacteraceae bacterium]
MSAVPSTLPAPVPVSRWRAGPRRLARLLAGLWIFGTGEGLLVISGLGVSPWTVLAEGVSAQSALGVGAATIAISFVVLALWVPLRQPPGLGTVLNAIVIGLAIAAVLALLPPPGAPALRWALMAGGIALVALGSGLYLACRLGPGPRDGLMTGLHRRTGRSVRLVRAGIEVAVLAVGFLLGGTVGVGTVAFALLIGPGVQASLGLLGDGRTDDL